MGASDIPQQLQFFNVDMQRCTLKSPALQSKHLSNRESTHDQHAIAIFESDYAAGPINQHTAIYLQLFVPRLLFGILPLLLPFSM
jgi:hypothetical protein